MTRATAPRAARTRAWARWATAQARRRRAGAAPAAGARHALLLTDGVPTASCLALVAEREAARAIGVGVHRVFIGDAAD